ncbi:MAG: DUF3268 family zinc-finger domain-containing protein [Chitinophagales bacterium]|nr:DUF3268 family zinc-finger domain-containing protein [Chitinophagales bacterium]
MNETYLKITQGQICPYCNCATKLVTGDEIYPHRIHEEPRPKFLDKKYYLCTQNDDHYVGTYADNITSLGRLADKTLRQLKHEGHNVFDPLWKTQSHFESQKAAYDWLSAKMQLPLEFTHFGMFTDEQCMEAIRYCREISL